MAAAIMREAIDLVASTGTRRDIVSVIFEGGNGEWGWSVKAHVLAFATPKGKRKYGSGMLVVRGWSALSPYAAAQACVKDIDLMVQVGREITSGGRVEVATDPTQ
jgi:hypothetical protein